MICKLLKWPCLPLPWKFTTAMGSAHKVCRIKWKYTCMCDLPMKISCMLIGGCLYSISAKHHPTHSPNFPWHFRLRIINVSMIGDFQFSMSTSNFLVDNRLNLWTHANSARMNVISRQAAVSSGTIILLDYMVQQRQILHLSVNSNSNKKKKKKKQSDTANLNSILHEWILYIFSFSLMDYPPIRSSHSWEMQKWYTAWCCKSLQHDSDCTLPSDSSKCSFEANGSRGS